MRLYTALKTWNKKRRLNRVTRKLGLHQYESDEALFSDYYKNRVWSGGKGETVSGSGSTLRATGEIREGLPGLFRKYHIRKVFDAPCGDYNWFQHIEREGVLYTGGDIVQDLIAENRHKHQDENTRFVHFDIIKDRPEDADLWLCRDVLLHFSFDNIQAFFNNFLASGIPYLLVSTYHTCKENLDIATGAGRELNLEIAPFNLPEPIDYVDEQSTGGRPRRLGLWRREEIEKALNRAGGGE